MPRRVLDLVALEALTLAAVPRVQAVVPVEPLTRRGDPPDLAGDVPAVVEERRPAVHVARRAVALQALLVAVLLGLELEVRARVRQLGDRVDERRLGDRGLVDHDLGAGDLGALGRDHPVHEQLRPDQVVADRAVVDLDDDDPVGLAGDDEAGEVRRLRFAAEHDVAALGEGAGRVGRVEDVGARPVVDLAEGDLELVDHRARRDLDDGLEVGELGLLPALPVGQLRRLAQMDLAGIVERWGGPARIVRRRDADVLVVARMPVGRHLRRQVDRPGPPVHLPGAAGERRALGAGRDAGRGAGQGHPARRCGQCQQH